MFARCLLITSIIAQVNGRLAGHQLGASFAAEPAHSHATSPESTHDIGASEKSATSHTKSLAAHQANGSTSDRRRPRFGGGESQRMIDQLVQDKIGKVYDKHSRPVPDCSIYDCSHRIRIFMGLSFKKLIALDQTSQTVTMVVQMRLTWPDYRLAYNSTKYFSEIPFFGQGRDFYWDSHTDFLPIEQGLVWSPDVQLLDAVLPPEEITLNPRLFWYDQHKLAKEGYNMAMVIQQRVTVNCPMDLSRFPFDNQTCHFRFGDWSASDRYFEFGTLDTGKIWSVPDINNEFHIQNIHVEKSRDKYDLQDLAQFPEVVYTVEFQRFPHYYLLHFVLPQFVLLLVGQSVYWMDLHGERHTMASAVLLAVMTTSFLIAPLLPETNEVMWLERFQIACYILTATPVLTSVMIEYYGYRSGTGAEWAAHADMSLRVLFPAAVLVFMVVLFYDVDFTLDRDILLFLAFNIFIYVVFLVSGIAGLTRASALQAEIAIHEGVGSDPRKENP